MAMKRVEILLVSLHAKKTRNRRWPDSLYVLVTEVDVGVVLTVNENSFNVQTIWLAGWPVGWLAG